MKHSLLLFKTAMLLLCAGSLAAQDITITNDPSKSRVTVMAGGKLFTEFLYPDSMEKPVLYPIYTSNGGIVTRGYPLKPRPNEPIDHPHHVGMWMNYESVNGLDFWNNSFAVPAEKKAQYGWIKTVEVGGLANGKRGSFFYRAHWHDIQKNVLLKERTTFYFTQQNNIRIIDRISTLTAEQDVAMKDVKDGFLGIRVAHELELPSKEERVFTDDKGNVTKINKSDNGVTGNYITSAGYAGDAAWGTRGDWCTLYGKLASDSVAITIIDHPANVGYPTYWHARGYGLFSANPLGQKIFSNGKEQLNFSLMKNESVTFRYRIIIACGNQLPSGADVSRLAKEFSKLYQ